MYGASLYIHLVAPRIKPHIGLYSCLAFARDFFRPHARVAPLCYARSFFCSTRPTAELISGGCLRGTGVDGM